MLCSLTGADSRHLQHQLLNLYGFNLGLFPSQVINKVILGCGVTEGLQKDLLKESKYLRSSSFIREVLNTLLHFIVNCGRQFYMYTLGAFDMWRCSRLQAADLKQ